MAASATARRIDLHHSGGNNVQADLDSQLAASHRFPNTTTTRASASTPIPTPRPSISPLSVAAPRSSRVARANATMSVNTAHADAELNQVLDVVCEAQDDRSSSLSEPDDDQDEDDDEGEGEVGESQDIDAVPQLPRTTLLGTQQSLEVDSEAETERLDQMTPQKLRERADSAGKTPSKLIRADTLDEDLSDPPSPLAEAEDVGAASSTSTLATTGNKRKRSSVAADSPLTSPESDLGESPRKRSHGSATEDVATEYALDMAVAREEGEEAAAQTLAELLPIPDRTLPLTAKGLKGRKSKLKGKRQKALAIDHTHGEVTPPPPPPEDSPAEDPTAKAEEDAHRKAAASTAFSDLAKHFAAYRDTLYRTRLAALDAELALLQPQSLTTTPQTYQQQQQPHQYQIQHPEYLRQLSTVTARLEKNVREAHAWHFYRTQHIRRRTLADRTVLHSQYFQHIRDVRERVLDDLGEEWYQIQRERRLSHQRVDDEEEARLFRYDPDRSAQITRQAKYNREVSVLSGFAKYVGFPAAPEIEGPQAEGLVADFKGMKILTKRPAVVANHPQPHPRQLSQQPKQEQHQHHAHQSQQQYPPYFLSPPSDAPVSSTLGAESTANSNTLRNPSDLVPDRQAEHQFLQRNAWARPQALPLTASSSSTAGGALGRPSLSPLLALQRGVGEFGEGARMRDGVEVRDRSGLRDMSGLRDTSGFTQKDALRGMGVGGLMTHTDNWAEVPLSGSRGFGRGFGAARAGGLGPGAMAGDFAPVDVVREMDGRRRSPLPASAPFPPPRGELSGGEEARTPLDYRRNRLPPREGTMSTMTMTTATLTEDPSPPGLAIAKHRSLHDNGVAQLADKNKNHHAEPTEGRNFSGLSGASTIDAPLVDDEETVEQRRQEGGETVFGPAGGAGDDDERVLKRGEMSEQGGGGSIARAGTKGDEGDYTLTTADGGEFWAPSMRGDARMGGPFWGGGSGQG